MHGAAGMASQANRRHVDKIDEYTLNEIRKSLDVNGDGKVTKVRPPQSAWPCPAP